MDIPGTQKIDANNVTPGNSQNELFCACVKNLKNSTYLNNFLQDLDQYLPDFVFSKQTLDLHEKLLREGKTTKTPIDKAREFLKKTSLSRTSDSGEFGEFLLYLFAKHIKGAQKLISTIQSRGNTNQSIPGRDGLFVLKAENGDVFMLLGEAKIRVDSNDGLRDAQQDMNDFWVSGGIHHQINLASTHLREELNTENADMYEAYFIDDNPQHAQLKYKNIVFVGYSFSKLTTFIQGKTTDKDLCDAIISDLNRCFTNQASLISSSPCPTIYCFLPFESADAARTEFARHNLLII
jgi:hypothetical protein